MEPPFNRLHYLHHDKLVWCAQLGSVVEDLHSTKIVVFISGKIPYHEVLLNNSHLPVNGHTLGA